VERVQNGLQGVEGSYSLTILTNDGHLLAVRDPWGNRPLSWGIFNNGFAVASETVAFDAVGAQVMSEVRPGEILDFSTQGLRRSWLLEEAEEARCVFEKIYFGFETSRDDGELHSDFRKRLGRIAGEEGNLNESVRGDFVSDVPESSTVAALEYAKVRNLEYQRLILKKKASFARSFMGADREKREELGEGKYTISPNVADQELEIVDDSAVRGTTSRVLIKNLRRMGAKRVKLVFTSPKVINDCRYGVDMNNSTGAFVARNQETGEIRSDEQIATTVGADEVQYMSLDQLKNAVDMGRGESKNYCMECFGGRGLGSLRFRSVEKPQMARAGELIQIG
jgi:amidophosphoribosyltransferase